LQLLSTVTDSHVFDVIQRSPMGVTWIPAHCCS
jgi:hypothetical protein